MDKNILFSQKTITFDPAPLESTYYLMTGKNLNDMELEIKNRDKEVMRQAL